MAQVSTPSTGPPVSKTAPTDISSQTPATTVPPSSASSTTTPLVSNVPQPVTNPSQAPARPAAQPHGWEKSWHKIKTPFSPSTHDVVGGADYFSGTGTTVRSYNHRKQRWRLWSVTFLELFTTLILCGAIAGLLAGYSQQPILETTQKRVFNAISTGLSVALGLNLAGSLRSCAQLLRWRLLAASYQPLSRFELILGLEKQTNVIQLFFAARNAKYRFLPSLTQFLCLLWILINLAATVLVAMIGLTYSLDQSNSAVDTTLGDVAIVDFSYLVNDGYYTGLYSAHQFGDSGTQFGIVDNLTVTAEAQQGTYESVGGTARYWFTDYNAQDYSINLATDRYVDSNALCQAFPVVEGQYGNLSSIVYNDGNGRRINVNIQDQGGPGGMLFISNTLSNCGPRCTNVNVLQAMSPPGDNFTSIDQALFFTCTNTITQIQNIPSSSSDSYLLSDNEAQILAGNIGWSGEQIPGDDNQYVLYPEESAFVYQRAANTTEVAQMISQYTIGGIAAMDEPDLGPQRKVIRGQTPTVAQYLNVTWKHTAPLLGVIPTLHFLSLAAVIVWANKAIIKDGTYLAAAKLYQPIIDRLGNHGCMMRGDEIIDFLKDPLERKEPEVTFGFTRSQGTDVMHAGIFNKGIGPKIERAFEEGEYDGAGKGAEAGADRRKKLKID